MDDQKNRLLASAETSRGKSAETTKRMENLMEETHRATENKEVWNHEIGNRRRVLNYRKMMQRCLHYDRKYRDWKEMLPMLKLI